MEDLAIVELYHQRKPQAIVESEKKYGALCRSIALGLLSIWEDAEECVNDTWHAAWNAIPPSRPQALGTFLGRITRNLSISRWRQNHAQKRYQGMEILLSELEDCVPAPDTVERHWQRQQLAQAISAWLDSLEQQDRILFIRRYWYGEGVKQLAARQGQRANTLSQRLGRLRKQLQAFLEQEGVEL